MRTPVKLKLIEVPYSVFNFKGDAESYKDEYYRTYSQHSFVACYEAGLRASRQTGLRRFVQSYVAIQLRERFIVDHLNAARYRLYQWITFTLRGVEEYNHQVKGWNLGRKKFIEEELRKLEYHREMFVRNLRRIEGLIENWRWYRDEECREPIQIPGIATAAQELEEAFTDLNRYMRLIPPEQGIGSLLEGESALEELESGRALV